MAAPSERDPEVPAAAGEAVPDFNLTRSDRDWVITIHAQLKQGRADEKAWPWSSLSVYNVPRGLREGDGRAYTPQVVSIGPLHHGNSRLREFERHKLRALRRVLGRTGHHVAAYLGAVRALEGRARACYEGHAGGMASNELVQCLVLEGTFVLKLLRGATTDGGEGFAGRLGYSPHDPVFAVRGVMQAVRKDMFLLENQVPLFVLDRLSRLQLDDPGQTGGVAGLAVRFFHPARSCRPMRRCPSRSLLSATRPWPQRRSSTRYAPFSTASMRSGAASCPPACSGGGHGRGAWPISGSGSSSCTACRSSGRPASASGCWINLDVRGL